ncbi:hypothetical protein Sjap_016245 [Stephania japonica]|uniref:C2 and GRAM domain-containing protein n=1 Tax=Stephania japonica TaxID=461633 RepID=A0AAP0IKR2_9MAGN
MGMRLYVCMSEAAELSSIGAYAKLQLGKYKAKTRVGGAKRDVSNNSNRYNHVWNEEFVFRVCDVEEELVVSVFGEEERHGAGGLLFGGSAGELLLGSVRVPVCSVLGEDQRYVPPTWFSLENSRRKGSAGKILMSLSLHGGSTSPAHLEELAVAKETSCNILSSKVHEGKQLFKVITSHLERIFHKNEDVKKDESRSDDSSDTSSKISDYQDCEDESFPTHSFDVSMELMQSTDKDHEMPEDLPGGVLLDQAYAISSWDLNMLLFAPDSQFMKEVAELQGTLDFHKGAWTWKCDEESSHLTRTVTYTKAATKLVKSVKATEEQTYVKANGREFAVLVSVSTPDVPYGNYFKIELLYKIILGPSLSSGEESARLIISWNVKFTQSTVMKGVIEGGARQGLKESFGQFAELLGQRLEPVALAEQLEKKQLLKYLETEHQSDFQLAYDYFCNFSVLLTVTMIIYVLLHILLSKSRELHGLEFNGLDLPDSLGELITSAVIVLLVEHVFNMIRHFVQARLQREDDRGFKSQGDGWVLTVALIEGSNLASTDVAASSAPYVVLTCNSKTRTSSVKLQTHNPQWNEVLEFDAMEEPPSLLDVEVFDFDGPFDQAASLGHSEINLLKHTSAELADIWVTLEGKLAQAFSSKLHMRIFLESSKGVDTIKEYLMKMEKEVGKKLSLRSPYRNSMFQKLFGLPSEEFLISDFSCSLKRKVPLQGRLFLSPRIVGFYANFFGHKTKFFFLWEDIDDVQVLPPSVSSLGSPSLVIILRSGRGLDASHGAKSQDEEGRLRFHYQAFLSFNVARRIILALWRTRSMSAEQKSEIGDNELDQDEENVQIEDSESLLGLEDANTLKIYSADLPIRIENLMEMFDGDSFEHGIMMKLGCLNYTTTPWEAVEPDTYQRHVCYKFNRHVSVFGGEVTSTQKKSPIADSEGWVLDDIISLHHVPFGDHIRVHLRYVIEILSSAPLRCQYSVYLGITWMKSIKFQQKITRNITQKFAYRVKEMFEIVRREVPLVNSHE